MTQTVARRGRPPLRWLEPDRIARLMVGTPLAVEMLGRHTARLVGRLTGVHEDRRMVDLWVPGSGDIALELAGVRRARIVDQIFEPGDAVLRRGVSSADWRGGVVRSQDDQVLVEQVDGSFAWFVETDLDPAESRFVPPPLPPGPVGRAR